MFLIIKNIQNNLYNYEQYSGELIIIYSSLISVIITMIYIEHTFQDIIEYKNLKCSKITQIFIIFSFICVFIYIFVTITNWINPIH